MNPLNERSADIFKKIVEAFLQSGNPVGSKSISSVIGHSLSPASIRNIMADLEHRGLLYSPHTSAGRLPTEQGLRIFIDGLLEVGALNSEEQKQINAQCAASDRPFAQVLEEATQTLSGLSQCAGMVLAPKIKAPIKHIEFVKLNEQTGLVILVFENGQVENRTIALPKGLMPSSLIQASNFINAKLEGRTLEEVQSEINGELKKAKAELDELTKSVIKAGLATWSGEQGSQPSLIVKGRSNLIDEKQGLENIERIRQLFDDLESKEEMVRLLDLTQKGDGVQIFIGAENRLFSLSGSSVVVAPYSNDAGQIVGALGVIGPTRINYARIIPIVDYTAKAISKLL